MKNLQAGRSVSTLQVLEVLSDRISVDIFNSIAEKVTTSDKFITIARRQCQAIPYKTILPHENRLNSTKASRTYSYIPWISDIQSPINNRFSL